MTSEEARRLAADPAEFAWELYRELPNKLVGYGNVPEQAEFERLVREAAAAFTPPPGISPWSRMVEAAHALAGATFEAGCRFGAAAEGLRRALPGQES